MNYSESLTYFMQAYYNQNFDEIFGNIDNVVLEFKKNESNYLIKLLINDLNYIKNKDLVMLKGKKPSSIQKVFWSGMGGMILTYEDIDFIIEKISDCIKEN